MNALREVQASGQKNRELIQHIAFQILEEGVKNSDKDTQLMSLLAAAIACHDKANKILEAGAVSENPEIQLAALQIGQKMPSSVGSKIALNMTSSPHAIIRLEALFYLAKEKHPSVQGHIESLIAKVPSELHPVFPQFYAVLGTPKAMRQLRRMMNDTNEVVRLASIVAATEHGRDDLLPQIRSLGKHPNAKQQEACATALGRLGDDQSAPLLRKQLESKVDTVQIAAATALEALGHEEARDVLFQHANKGNLYAITSLGKVPGSEEVLFKLLKNPQTGVRLNASLALLERRDPRCVRGIQEILIPNARDLAVATQTSPGHGLNAWKVIPSLHATLAENPIAVELALNVKEEILRKCRDLPEEAFLEIAERLFQVKNNALIPTLIPLLENLSSPSAIALLKQKQEQVGAPLIRNYCNLALFRLGEEGPYENNLKRWLAETAQIDCIQMRANLEKPKGFRSSPFLLTPREASQLFLASVEALAGKYDERGIDMLLDLMVNGNPKNRYVLAGLLIRATQ